VSRLFNSKMAMFKIVNIFVIGLAFVSVSCGQVANNTSANKIGNYKCGDCFEFKEKIKDFGVVFLERQNDKDTKEFSMFPVKLDETKTGIDRFKYGRVYISNYPDATKATGITEGFRVFYFMNQDESKQIKVFFSFVGQVALEKSFKNATGGTMASSLDEFKLQLRQWDKMFGENGHLVLLKDLLD
jgi:hypothetical protein